MPELVIAIAVGVCLLILAWRLLRAVVAIAVLVVLVALGVGMFHHLGLTHTRASSAFTDARHSVLHDASQLERGARRVVQRS